MSEVTVMNGGWDSNKERRVVVVWVDEHEVFEAFRLLFERDAKEYATRLKLRTRLPEDIRVVGVLHQPMRRAYGVMLRSQEFNLVPEGCQAPSIEPFDRGGRFEWVWVPTEKESK